MATYFVSAGGSNTSPYDTWAKAATSLQTAITAASSDGDVVVIEYNDVPASSGQDGNITSDTAYTAAADISIISASNDDEDQAYTLTAMGSSGTAGTYIGSNGAFGVTFGGADKTIHVWGLTIRLGGTAADFITLANSSGQHSVFDNCYLWCGSTNSGAAIRWANNTGAIAETRNCTLRYGSTSQVVVVSTTTATLTNCTISGDGSAPASLFVSGAAADTRVVGTDLSALTTICPNSSAPNLTTLVNCKIPASPFTAQSANPSLGSPQLLCLDCSTSTNHFELSYYNAYGELTCTTSVYADDGAEYVSTGTKHSWKIVTTANANQVSPFVTPFISVHNETLSALSPYIEAASATSGLDESQLWSQWFYKAGTSTVASLDRTDMGTFESGQSFDAGTQTPYSVTDQAAGSATWTGLTEVAYKLAPDSAITPGAIGDIYARVCVSIASHTLYVDPQIRGLS